jgi:hypothetical protein
MPTPPAGDTIYLNSYLTSITCTTSMNTIYYSPCITSSVPCTISIGGGGGGMEGVNIGGGGGGDYPAGWTDLGYVDENGIATYYSECTNYVTSPAPELTDEQRAQQAEAQAAAQRMRLERQAAQEAERERRATAEARATELLISLLPEDQKEYYRLNGQFEIIGSNGTRYRITRGIAGNIYWLDAEGRVGGSLCCHAPVGSGDRWMPTQDVMLGQMLALQTDEPDFLRVANLMSGRRPPIAQQLQESYA